MEEVCFLCKGKHKHEQHIVGHSYSEHMWHHVHAKTHLFIKMHNLSALC